MSLLYAGRHAAFRPHSIVVSPGASLMPAARRAPHGAEPVRPEIENEIAEQPDHGRGVHATWTYTLGSIVFVVLALASVLVLMAVSEFNESPTLAAGAVLVALLASTAVQLRYCWFLRRGRGGGLPRTAWTVALLASASAVWVLGLFAPGLGLVSAFPLWMALCLMACLLPKRQRRLVLAAGLAAVAVHPALTVALGGAPAVFPGGDGPWLLICYGVLFPVMLLSGLWWWEIVVELDHNRRAAAELAVARERLRFASDLHDIQGHHLQVIALKSELAERLLDIDVDAARANIHETRLIAKQALEETRLLVAGYREVALDEELENAREVLAAAGADCELDVDVLPANAELHRALALTVREATTNILRHSTATRAAIRLRVTPGGCSLSISNNGVSDAGAADDSPGSGLAGLRERVAVLDGQLDAAASGDSFELRVDVPARVGATA
ncbi:two-component system sensor histidine kinase DesK [Microterricola gilva]|uniref:Two-component system sensor histidine kinase DesK n=2 Tax=Microterricola gilva TaxID=393267 RepID=A0A4Q8AHG5_9MICO|nr:two-component system sensor histidine kinase DesK [Microterricola gilva]